MIIDNTINRSGLFLTILALVLFTTKTLFIFPLFFLSIIGIILIFTAKIDLRTNPYKPLTILFLFLWLPLALSSIDAVDSERAISKTLAYACFLPASLFVIYSINNKRIAYIVHTSIFVILCVWIIDGSIQFFIGNNLFGYPYTPPQLMGMFYPKVRMPYFLAIFAPLFLEFIRIHFKTKRWLIVLLIPFGMMILLGGKRSAWIMLAFSGTGYLIYLYLLYKSVNLKNIALIVVFVFLPLGLLGYTHAPLHNRIASTLELFSKDFAAIDKATAHRLELWKVSVAITKDNLLNGVGPRGYRHVFNKYADENNFWIRSGYPNGTTHPHLMILEVACETGLPGLFGYMFFYFFLVRITTHEIKNRRLQSVPWLLCPLAAFFPLNAHLAFYGSYWSSVCWWALAVSLAVVNSSQYGKNTDH